MADLGAIGTADTGDYASAAFDVFSARDASLNIPTCYSRSDVDTYFVARYRDLWRELRGSVQNSAGVGIARRVIAIDNRTGVLRGSVVSEADGTFVMTISSSYEAVTVIAVPDAGDARNVVVFDAVLPVAPL